MAFQGPNNMMFQVYIWHNDCQKDPYYSDAMCHSQIYTFYNIYVPVWGIWRMNFSEAWESGQCMLGVTVYNMEWNICVSDALTNALFCALCLDELSGTNNLLFITNVQPEHGQSRRRLSTEEIGTFVCRFIASCEHMVPKRIQQKGNLVSKARVTTWNQFVKIANRSLWQA